MELHSPAPSSLNLAEGMLLRFIALLLHLSGLWAFPLRLNLSLYPKSLSQNQSHLGLHLCLRCDMSIEWIPLGCLALGTGLKAFDQGHMYPILGKMQLTLLSKSFPCCGFTPWSCRVGCTPIDPLE